MPPLCQIALAGIGPTPLTTFSISLSNKKFPKNPMAIFRLGDKRIGLNAYMAALNPKGDPSEGSGGDRAEIQVLDLRVSKRV
jgi:hypothetical protein